MRSGGLFAGYGGLDMAVAEVFGARPAWFSEIDEAPSKILAHHWPTVPNLGDITQIDWDAVEPVDILTGGFPCQDVSAAGKRAGLRPGTRSGLWNHMAYAISKLRPRFVVAENVRGLLSAEAHSNVEPCPWCLGDGPGEPALRALGAVLGDLSDLGYDAQWCGLRAADVGAPHGRFRVFVLASIRYAGYESGGSEQRQQSPIAACGPGESGPLATEYTAVQGLQGRAGGRLQHRESGPGCLATADASGTAWREPEPDDLGSGPYAAAEPGERAGIAAHTSSQRHGDTRQASLRGLPATAVAGATTNPPSDGRHEGWPEPAGQLRGSDAAERGSSSVAWGGYRPAVERWERVLGRLAPAPTEISQGWVAGKSRRFADRRPVGHRGSLHRFLRPERRLSPQFVEWMMGLPAGHVTDVPGVNRNAQLKALGNGVVPQQATAALRHMLLEVAA